VNREARSKYPAQTPRSLRGSESRFARRPLHFLLRASIEFQVEQEDSVYPMVPAGSDLDAMIRRPAEAPAEVEG